MSATYGELMALGENSLLATFQATTTPSGQLVEDASRLLRALAQHTQLLVPLGLAVEDRHDARRDRAARRLAEALEPARHHRPAPRSESAPPSPWHQAAVAVDLAAQILRQHLGVDGHGSTPHTPDVLDPRQRWQALVRLTVLARAAAYRLEESIGLDPAVRDPDRRRLAYITDPLTARASVLIDADHHAVYTPDRLERLSAPPDLSRPAADGDDGTVLHELVQRVLLAAYRQAQLERRASRADLLGYALLAAELRRDQLNLDPFTSDLARQTAIRSRRAWVAVQHEWQDLQVADISPAGTRIDLAHALRILDGGPRRARPSDVAAAVHDGLGDLPDLARYSGLTVKHLAARGLLLQPTRQRDDLDCPRPWTATSPDRDQALNAAYQQVLHIEGKRPTPVTGTPVWARVRRADQRRALTNDPG